MNIYRRTILLLSLLAPSFRAFSCWEGLTAFISYDKKEDFSGEILCGFNSSCNFEDYLNTKYGANNWEYDEEFYIDYPTAFENDSMVPIITGTKEKTLAETFTEVSIIVEGEIHLENAANEVQIVKVAKFKFSKKSFLFVSTKLNLSSVPNPRVNMYAVYGNNYNKKVKVAKPPHTGVGATGCTFYYFVK